MALDEIGNLSPLTSLTVLMAEGDGTSSAKDLQDLSALVLLRSAPPLVTDLRPWTARKNAHQLREQRTKLEAALQRR